MNYAGFAQPPQPAPVWQLASWLSRGGALIIDQLLIGLIIVALAVPFVAMSGGSIDNEDDLVVGIFLPILLLGLFVVPTVYYCWSMSKTNGQTPGKKVAGIRVVREDGAPITAGFAFRRQIFWISIVFSFLGGIILFNLPILIDYLWPLWDDKNQALHDKCVNSRVVLADQVAPMPHAPPQPYYGVPAAQYPPPQYPAGPYAPPPAQQPAVPVVPPDPFAPPVQQPAVPVVPPDPFAPPVAPPAQQPPAPPQPPAPQPPAPPAPAPPAPAPPPPARPSAPPPHNPYQAPRPPQPPPPAQPAQPQAPGNPVPYTPPPGFDNPVPEDN
ncbi:MAG: RDD family protein [Solirubrobacterales bacterium]